MEYKKLLKIEKKGLIPEYFPTAMQAFIFRNWNMISKERLAEVLETSVENVEREAVRMGLSAQGDVSAWLKKGYITIIRSNWHLLPYEQLLMLLGWDEDRLSIALKEDDFLDIKLGNFKPDCEKVLYRELTDEEVAQTEKIRNAVENAAMSITEMREPFEFFNKKRKPSFIGKPKKGQAVLDDRWYIKDLTDDRFAAKMAERFAKSIKAMWGIDLSADNGERAVELSFVKDKQEEYHEICITSDKIEIKAGGSGGIQRALSRLEDIASANGGMFFDVGKAVREPRFETRFIYSFSALYDGAFDVDSRTWCSDSLLEEYARIGVNGIWLQGVLYRLTEFPFAPEMSDGWQKRLSNLRSFAERARSYGIRIYLYLNEPRAMPHSFFEKYPELKGSKHDNYTCMCVSNPKTRDYIKNAVEKLCREVPDLGGFFTITMSENPTHCLSRKSEFSPVCPVCGEHSEWEFVAEVNSLIREGARRVSSDIQVIAWNWGWTSDWDITGEDVEKCLKTLPKDISVMCQREQGLPFTVGGVSSRVNEYSLSVGGISETTKDTWALAKKYGHKTAVKLQINNTWECSTAPYLPIYPSLISCMDGLIKSDVNHLMLSWTLGGYPSPNIKLISESFFIENGKEEPDYDFVFNAIYGNDCDKVKEATEIFCKAFSEFPFSMDLLYYGPQNAGVSNPLYKEPTGYKATMTCYSYDDIESWRAIYPAEVAEEQYKKVSDLWKIGLDTLEGVTGEISDVAFVCYSLFRSSCNQMKFYRLRNGQNFRENVSVREEMRKIIADEREIAATLYPIMRRRPEIGFEAANHYYFNADAVLEKIINCDYLAEYYK